MQAKLKTQIEPGHVEEYSINVDREFVSQLLRGNESQVILRDEEITISYIDASGDMCLLIISQEEFNYGK